MKRNYIIKIFVSVLLLAGTYTMQAQNSWAMATIEDGKDWPSVTWYICQPEKGANGIDYLRIYDKSHFIHREYRNPVKQQYGYRMADKQIFIYDFEKDEERLAFDFTLSAGDHFTTYNGIEWEVDAVMDTLVNISYKGEGESSTKRLLKVHSVNGRYSDQWLEDFGSFANHFMVLPMIESGQMHTLWMEYEYGHNLVREISSDPIYTHVTDYPDEINDGPTSYDVTYNDGTLKVESMGMFSPNRSYSCYYRVGDGLYCVYVWIVSPGNGAAYVVWHHDIAYYYGLPEPQSGKYTIYSMDEKPSGIVVERTNNSGSSQTESPIYDLQGRKLTSKPTNGIYIFQGQIKFAESRE